MIKIIKVISLKVLGIFIYVLDYLVPKDNKLFIFSQRNGQFSDNSKSLFQYMQENSELLADVRTVWITKNKGLVDNKIFLDICSLSSFWVSLRAKHFIVCHGSGELFYSRYFSKKKNTIVLWHAIMLKKYGFLDASYTQKDYNSIKKERDKYTLFLASSKLDALSVSACNQLESDRVLITGLPRNDILFNPPAVSRLHGVSEHIKEILNKKVILYAPTFRDGGLTQFFPFEDLKIESIAKYLRKNNAYMLIRPHQNDRKNIQRLKDLIRKHGERFILADINNVIDVAEIIPYVDTIITDYSSIYLDALLLNCPCVFIPYDLEEYESARGIIYDYDMVTPGAKVKTQAEFLDALSEALNGGLKYQDRRNQVRDMFHAHQDGKASQRVAKKLLALVACR
ncbi:hypothetical protein FM042_05005 [Aliidiomarina halalkaliphila]|uniref:CDP-glycerol--glycerophosphate glycerophosphotransferase n=1 Tax=Aliidiomarina halalkaliphila TaxID=2593535 RepID=A0A552X5F3_9GAMM|nr:CDP-glycerol glycerophosphotransferase family protein [Aliidiomarina halalkaliphila]TRW50196.1 hypothetical protein FM042_05005 [Aliidiomarina halalkaliphila]